MGTTSRQAFEVAVEYVSHAKAAIAAMVVDDPARPAMKVKSQAGDGSAELHFDPSIAAPPRVRSRGRPKELRYKSPIESPGARKRPASTSTGTNEHADEPPRRSTRFLKTGVYIVEHCGACGSTQHRTSACSMNVVEGPSPATQRRCKSCGETGHNRSTCGRKSTYVAK
jgi:hypothetical protein